MEGPFSFQPGFGFSEATQPGPGRLSSQGILVPVPGVCGCCGALRPRYKRLVDNIFPEDPEVGPSPGAIVPLTISPGPGPQGEAGPPGSLSLEPQP